MTIIISNRPTAIGLLLSASLLSGCAVGPDYQSPDISVTSRFLGQDGIGRHEIQSKADLQTWWAAFDDPMLTRFVALALDQNLDMALAAARVAQARASLRLADAALLPSANVSAQGVKNYQSLETPLGQVLSSTPGLDRRGSYYEASLGASWEIDVFGGLRRGQEAARAEYQASEAGAVATRLAVAAQRRMCTSRSGDCKRASRSPGNKRRRAVSFSRRSCSSTRRGSPPSCKCAKPRARSLRSRRKSPSWTLRSTRR